VADARGNRYDLVVRNGTVVTSAGRREADIAISDGRFAAIAERGQLQGGAAEELDAAGRHVVPGVIDGHVHFREPGFESKEDWLSGSRAAVMGGVTTVLDMPNTNPQTRDPETARVKKALAEATSYCDFGLIGLVASENVDQLRPMAEQGLVMGYKAFLGESVASIPPPDDGALLAAMREIAALGMRLGFHAENNQILQHEIRRLRAAGRHDALAHLESRPPIAEVESIQRMGLFAQETGCPIHIFHLSSAPGLAMIEAWRARGVDCTCETGAHYCFLSAADVRDLGSVVRVNPPARGGEHADALLAGLADGRITCIASDHAPHAREEKLTPDIWGAMSGVAGVEISVPLFLTLGVNAGRLTLERFVGATSEGPARTWRLWPRKGALAVGSDADLTILDLRAAGTIRAADLHGKTNISAFEGRRTIGAAVGTIVRGAVQMRDGVLTGRPGHGRGQSPEPAPQAAFPEPPPA
jgi:allantoinase